jgi:hypothetical protein
VTATISVTATRDGDPLAFDVTVFEGGSETRHDVTLSQADYVRLACGATPERVIEAAFRFLLDREPKESILRRFDLSVISRYFPEFVEKRPYYLS